MPGMMEILFSLMVVPVIGLLWCVLYLVIHLCIQLSSEDDDDA